MQMSSQTLIIVAIASATCLLNIGVSVCIARSGYYERNQVLAQAAIVWFVPIFGAVCVGLFLLSQRDSPKFDTRACPERSEKAIGVELDVFPRHHAP